jgi:uncharacterized protein YndB with AHSA1/START domain
MKNRTTVERKSDREVVVSRTVNGPARLVFEAWTRPELLQRWWAPKSTGMSLVSCEVDARVGGKLRFVFGHGGREMAFFGKYLEVVPPSRLVWTNEERGEDSVSITTATFEEHDGKTRLVVSEVYPSKEAFEEAHAEDAAAGMPEQLDQLEELLVSGW